MNCKLITENDCAVSAVLSCSPVEFLIINKAIARCSESTDYAEADRRTMVLMSEAMKNFEQVEVADTPQKELPKQIRTPYEGDIKATPQTDCIDKAKADIAERSSWSKTYEAMCEPQTDCAWMYDSRRDYEYDKALDEMERNE